MSDKPECPVAELRPGNHRGAQPHRAVRRARSHALSAGAERLPAHRPRQVDLPELRPRGEVRRQVQPPLRRHQPHHRGAGVRRFHPRRRPLARGRLGGPRVLRLRLLRPTLRVGREADPRGQGVRGRPAGRRRSRSTAATSRAGKPSPYRDRSVGGEPRPVPPHEGRRVPRRGAHPAGEDRHELTRTSTCATRSCTASCTRSTTAPATSGASTRCTTTPTAQSDSIEGITHSICTLEFEIHRPLYDWYVDAIGIYHPQQIEFARLNLTYTVLSKRKLIQLVTEKHVSGLGRSADADDLRRPPPRLHARGDAEVLRADRRVEVQRRHRHVVARRRPARRPEQDGPARDGRAAAAQGRHRELPRRPDRRAGRGQQPGGRVGRARRKVPFSKVLYIEQDDFRENPPKDFFRLAPGPRGAASAYAYFITCVERGEGRRRAT